ncbi:MAG: sodium:solute symporter family transporter [Candidatus Methanofastidiosia archaeon]
MFFFFQVLREQYEDHKNIINPDADDKKITLYSRIVVVIVAIVTMVLAINPPSLLAWLIWMAIGITLSVFVVPIVAGLYWKRATREGALASMIIGFASAVVFGYIHKFVTPLPMHFSIYSFAIAVAAMVIVSLATKPPSAKTIKRTHTGLFIKIKEEK